MIGRRLVTTALALIVLSLFTPARSDEPRPSLDVAYDYKAAGDLGAALEAFETALRASEGNQRILLEIGYTNLALRDFKAAGVAFAAAASGADRELAAQARRELEQLPDRWSADLYAESVGWYRARGAVNLDGDLVPTVRVRGRFKLLESVDLDAYIFAQATRDVASESAGQGAVPQIYADDYAMTGAGLLLRAWGGRAGLFAQIGPAFALLDTGDRVDLDARAGATLGAETGRCRDRHAGLAGCLEIYSEGVYASRFDNNIIGFARGRAALNYLSTGPLLWQYLVEARVAADLNRDDFNNFVDAGAGHRWRLLSPFALDVVATANAGTYLQRDRGYADLRILAATYLEF